MRFLSAPGSGALAAETERNPVLAGPDGVLAVDAKMRLARVGDEPGPSLRRLPEPA